jgi:RND family efflux transporter MFP subunit
MNLIDALKDRKALVAVAFLVVCALRPAPCRAGELEGLVEPFRSLRIATDESGTVSEVFVEEGQPVAAGQPLVRLNSEVLEASLAIAAQNMSAEGRFLAARADRMLRLERLEKLRSIQEQGFARLEEVTRASTELEIAEANLRSAKEDTTAKQLEHRRFQIQLNRRTVVAPMAGIVTKVHKDLGEYVAPNSPEIATLVQLDTLLALFTLTGSQAARLSKGDELRIVFPEGEDCRGQVEFLSPVMDAESGTVLLKVRIGNQDGVYRSGQRCRLQLPD